MLTKIEKKIKIHLLYKIWVIVLCSYMLRFLTGAQGSWYSCYDIIGDVLSIVHYLRHFLPRLLMVILFSVSFMSLHE